MDTKGVKLDLGDGDGHGGAIPEEEDQEQLATAYKKLGDLTRPDGSLVSISKQDLSLLKQVLLASEAHKQEVMWRMCDFVDEEEALDHVAAYYEALDLGMDTSFNVAFMFALVSTNRKGYKNNLIAQLLDTLQHGKWAGTSIKGKSNGSGSTRSPISSG